MYALVFRGFFACVLSSFSVFLVCYVERGHHHPVKSTLSPKVVEFINVPYLLVGRTYILLFLAQGEIKCSQKSVKYVFALDSIIKANTSIYELFERAFVEH